MKNPETSPTTKLAKALEQYPDKGESKPYVWNIKFPKNNVSS